MLSSYDLQLAWLIDVFILKRCVVLVGFVFVCTYMCSSVWLIRGHTVMYWM